MKLRPILLSFLLIAAFAPARVLAAASLQEGTMEHLGVERSYAYHLPEEYISLGRIPAVVVLHGGQGSGKQAANRWGFNAVADAKGFIVIYPDGLHRQWNDGRGKNFGVDYDGASEVDDVGYIAALIKHFVKNYNADPKRIYVTGASNGGMMTFRVGCELANKIAGIAPIVANIPEAIYDDCKPAKPLAMLLMNSTDDPLVPYDGGEVTIKGKEYGSVVSTDESVALWTETNKCSEDADISTLPDKDADDDTVITMKHFVQCAPGADVELYTVENGGHMIPGVKAPLASVFLGNENRDIKAAEVIWDFFEKSAAALPSHTAHAK